MGTAICLILDQYQYVGKFLSRTDFLMFSNGPNEGGWSTFESRN